MPRTEVHFHNHHLDFTNFTVQLSGIIIYKIIYEFFQMYFNILWLLNYVLHLKCLNLCTIWNLTVTFPQAHTCIYDMCSLLPCFGGIYVRQLGSFSNSIVYSSLLNCVFVNELSELHTDSITNNRISLRIRCFWRASDRSWYPNQSMKGSSSPTSPGLFAILENFHRNTQSSKKLMGLSESGSFPPQVHNPLWEKYFYEKNWWETLISIFCRNSMFVDTYISHWHACKHFNRRE